MIFDHNSPQYQKRWETLSSGKFNGAYYYSCEIVRNIIPRVQTDRSWVTINCVGMMAEHSIVFIHNNKTPQRYSWIDGYHDLILVCGIPETMPKVRHIGHPIYLPLSVDVEEVERYRRPKDRDVCFVGRPGKRLNYRFPKGTKFVEGMPREELLSEMARYRKVYAVGRCAIEAKILDCEVLPYDSRFLDPDRWKIFDNKDAAALLQKKLDRIDGVEHEH